MKKILLYVIMVVTVISCKNPFQQENVADSPANFAIQNTESGKILLRLKPEIGDKNQMQMRVELKPTGMMLPMNTDVIADMKMRMVQITDSGNVFHIDFQRMRMNAKILGMDINYDSQKENTDIPQEIKNQVEPILSKKITMVMDTLAHVTSLEFDQNKNNNSIDLNALFIPLPEQEVGVGDSWTAKQNVQNVENAQLTYTVESISETEVLVKVKQPDNENAKVKGQYLIDRKTGFTKDGVLDIETQQEGNGIRIKIVVDSGDEVLDN